MVILGALYAAYVAALIALQGQFIYPFQDRPFSSTAYDAVEINVPDADPLTLRVARGREGAPVVVYFMGNVGALDIFLPMLEHHRKAGRSVVAMPYRGGGGTSGSPSEARLKADALATLDALPGLVSPGAKVVIHGYSLGTGLAIHAAARRDVDGVVLSAPFARMCELMEQAVKVPACDLPGVQAWKTIEDLDGVTAPVLVLHGAADTLVPPEHSARLAAAMSDAGIDVARETFATGTHSNLMRVPGYLGAIDTFIDTYP